MADTCFCPSLPSLSDRPPLESPVLLVGRREALLLHPRGLVTPGPGGTRLSLVPLICQV